ncbi:MAG: lipopolysaccharide kinase InaA family protein [Longimicrobiales bacterium]|nr:lipopolysaccharide kinase InaA family protein [Longimicrobiales bacterium]
MTDAAAPPGPPGKRGSGTSGGSGDLVEIERPHARVLARPEARSWVETALDRHETLHRAASSAKGGIRMEGRGTVYAVPAPPDEIEAALGSGEGRWAIRHYRRGGWVAPLLGDRYLKVGTPRPFQELRVSDEVRRRKLPTPRVVAAAVYPSGIFYRGDLVTVYIPDSLELAEVLFDPRRRGVSSSIDRREAMAETGSLIRRMADTGVEHVDLNARNILLRWSGRAPEAHLLDLDRCKLRDGPLPRAARSMHDRLLRSIRKLEKKTDLRVAPGEIKALGKGLER